MGDEEEEAERKQQQRQQGRRSQVQQEGAAEDSASRETPQEEVQAEDGAGRGGEPLPYGWRRAHSLPPSLRHHSGLNSLAELVVWRRRHHHLTQSGWVHKWRPVIPGSAAATVCITRSNSKSV